MTSSFGITPQRQIRDLVAQPEKPAALPAPAQPSAIPQQVGGQLMYAASFQRDTAAEQGIKNIENFLAQGGVFERGSTLLFENYKAEKRQQAERILASEATAYKDLIQNASETEQLKKKGEFELARQNQLSNPWTNFYYYDAKATNAGNQIAVNLASWGKQAADSLAELPVDQRAAILAAKAQELKAEYSDIPEAYQAAKIDPPLSATLFDLKRDLDNKAFELNDRITRQTAGEKLKGAWKLGASFSAATGYTTYNADAIKKGIEEYRDWLINKNNYSGQQATDAFAELFDKNVLLLDADGNGLSDIGHAYSASDLIGVLSQIDVNGVKLTDLRDSKNRPLGEVIQAAADRATKRDELREGSIERGIQRQKRQAFRTIETTATDWWIQNPNADDNAIIEQIKREEANAAIKAKQLGIPYQDFVDEIRKNYKLSQKLLTPERKQELIDLTQAAIDNQIFELPANVREEAKGSDIYPDLLKMINEAKSKDNAADRTAFNKTRADLIKDLKEGLRGQFLQDPQIKEMATDEAGVRSQKDKLLKQAITEAGRLLQDEATSYFSRKLNEARAAGKDITDSQFQRQLLIDAERSFFTRPEYNDVDYYYNLEPGKFNKTPITGSKKDTSGRWVFGFRDTDNRAAWSLRASSTFGNNPKLARAALDSQLFFNQTEMGELVNAAITDNPQSVSNATRASLQNLNTLAFKGQIPISELVERQIKTFFGNKNLPPNIQKISKNLQAITQPAVAVTGPMPSDVALKITNPHHSHSKNRAIDVTLVRQNNQLANNVPSPISGKVIFAGMDGGFGLSVIIEASNGGPGYNKRDRLRISHLARLYWKEGDVISKGRPVGKSGDDSPFNSNPGYSGTGAGDPGHVHFQLYKPGPGRPTQEFQYEDQSVQARFIQLNLVPMFRRK